MKPLHPDELTGYTLKPQLPEKVDFAVLTKDQMVPTLMHCIPHKGKHKTFFAYKRTENGLFLICKVWAQTAEIALLIYQAAYMSCYVAPKLADIYMEAQ